MSRSIFLGAIFTFMSVALVGAGCGKKNTPASGGGAGGGSDTPPPSPSGGPEPKPKPKSKQEINPVSQLPYDPTKAEVGIDLAKTGSYISAKEPTAAVWAKTHGKVAEVRGIMGHLSADQQSRRDTYLVLDEATKKAIACESFLPPDWRKVGPGMNVTVVGLIEAKQDKDGSVSLRLNDAHVMSESGEKNAEVTAEQLGKEYSANPSGFEKKWKVPGKYYYVTGTLKNFDKIPLSNGIANKFRIAAGSTDLYCHIQNERGLKENPPKQGDKVTLLVECQGYDGGFKGISMGGVYVEKQ